MTAPWGLQPAPTKTRGPRFWITLAAVVVVLVLLLIAAPVVVALLGLLALLFAVVVLLIGRARWARIPHRKAAAGVAGASLALVIVAGAVGASQTPVPPMADAAAQESPAASAEPELASFVGQACDGDELVMTQDGKSNYCDENDGGSFVWVAAAEHEKAEAAAVAFASDRAVEQARAEKAAAAKASAEAKQAARDQAAAKAKAQQAEAAKKAAAEKKAADKKAAAQAQAKKAAQQESARKAQAAQAARAAEQKAADQAAAARKQNQVAQPAAPKKPASAYYKNCTAVRAAGAAPIYAGEPGYSRKLDRDGDGVGCE